MKAVKLKYSKSTIDKAGEVLKKKHLSSDEIQTSLKIISNWRAYHAMPLDIFAKVLRTRVKTVDQNSSTIVVQRLKRTPSILLKLKTHKTMRLSAMQDIGGLRAIFDNAECANKLVEIYRTSKSRHELFSLNNYVEKPKDDGYRSIHLVYKLKKRPDLFIEIQVRSHFQHIWATAVEVFGTLKKSSFKSGLGEKKWLVFFEFLSSIFALKEGTPIINKHCKLTKRELLNNVKKKIDALKVIEKLSMYTTVYKISSEDTKAAGRKGLYFLILLNSNENTITIKRFSANQIEEAIKSYIREEQQSYNDININIVLVHSDDIEKLKASYPNYFMDTQVLIRYLSEIMTDKFI